VFEKHSDERVLNGGECDIGWDYGWDHDVCSLKFRFDYSKPLIIVYGPNQPSAGASIKVPS